MQLVHFTDEHIGSLDWELPPHLATFLDSVSAEEREVIIGQLTVTMQAFTHTLMGAMKMGPFTPLAFELINAHGAALSQELLNVIKTARG